MKNKQDVTKDPSAYFITFVINLVAIFAFTIEILSTHYPKQFFLGKLIMN